MMSSERMGYVTLNDLPPLSPELQLRTMNTCDMFDPGWDCSSAVDSRLSGIGKISPSHSIQNTKNDEDFFSWDSDHVLQANLLQTNIEQSFEGGIGLLSFAEDCLAVEGHSFLHDTASNMSDASSSSSTITSHSVPQSPDHSLITLEEISSSDAAPTTLMFSSLSSNLDNSSPLSCMLPDVFCEESQENLEAHCSQEQQESRKRSKMNPNTKGFYGRKSSYQEKCRKSHRSPLTAASQPSSCSNRLSNFLCASAPNCQAAPCQRYRVTAKENDLCSRKKKILSILDSNVKWSELNSSEQYTVGEGLGTILSQCLGVRERLDLLRLLRSSSSESPLISSGDVDYTSSLDDEKFESVRVYLRELDNEGGNKMNKLTISKYEKAVQKQKISKSVRKRESYLCLKEHQNKAVQKADKRCTTQSTMIDSIIPPRNGHYKQVNYSSYFKDSKKKSSSQKFHQSIKVKKSTTQDLLQLRTRTRKEYRQLMKEKRSGLFEHEVVVSLSATACQTRVQQQDQDDEDIDILS